jgi:pimeloyl-ACP methyl ester carboxylesterase
MDSPEPRYAKTMDGAHVAYAVMGDGPIDLVYAFGYLSNIDADAEVPFHAAFRRRLASFSRLIVFDRRGTGLSDRSGIGDAGSLEAGVDDIRAVMDAAGSERALLFGLQDGGMLCALFAASHPDRTLGLVLWGSRARGRRSADYPWARTDEEWATRLEEVERMWGSVEFAQSEMRAVAPGVPMDPPTIQNDHADVPRCGEPRIRGRDLPDASRLRPAGDPAHNSGPDARDASGR